MLTRRTSYGPRARPVPLQAQRIITPSCPPPGTPARGLARATHREPLRASPIAAGVDGLWTAYSRRRTPRRVQTQPPGEFLGLYTAHRTALDFCPGGWFKPLRERPTGREGSQSGKGAASSQPPSSPADPARCGRGAAGGLQKYPKNSWFARNARRTRTVTNRRGTSASAWTRAAARAAAARAARGRSEPRAPRGARSPSRVRGQPLRAVPSQRAWCEQATTLGCGTLLKSWEVDRPRPFDGARVRCSAADRPPTSLRTRLPRVVGLPCVGKFNPLASRTPLFCCLGEQP